jgi:hypothetical protein
VVLVCLISLGPVYPDAGEVLGEPAPGRVARLLPHRRLQVEGRRVGRRLRPGQGGGGGGGGDQFVGGGDSYSAEGNCEYSSEQLSIYSS